jgi:hypothetical protein
MPKPRKVQISLETTPYYHCVSRCVRSAFLCGVDTRTGKNHEHRRLWIVERIKELTKIFAIDTCAYSVMQNHYHVVLHVDAKRAAKWNEQQVIERWKRLFSLPVIVERSLSTAPLSNAERDVVTELVNKWRQRLHDISWFMRCINEPIARKANQEDKCTGRYWEGRYKSQALLDEKALATCMAYVDLNPVRAGVSETPEQSEYTSIAERAKMFTAGEDSEEEVRQPIGLLPFAGNPRKNMPKGLPFQLKDYLTLVDCTGRAILENKPGYIHANQPPILERLQIDTKHWLYLTQHFESQFKGFVGAGYKLIAAYRKLGYQRTPNLSVALHYFT